QDRCAARPVIGGAAPYGVGEFGVDGHQGVAVHLVVEVAQVGGAVGVGGDTVAAQPQGIGDTQSAVHQDESDQPVGRAVETVEVGECFELGHDMFGQSP